MMEPCCAVCGETKIANLLMFNYGMCLCHRCTEIAAQSFIHDNAERKLKETEKKAISVEGLSKAEYESMTELKDKLRKENDKLRKENDNLLVRIADAHIVTNRFRRRYEDAQAAYKQLRFDRRTRYWTAITAGMIMGAFVGLIIGIMF